MKDSCDSQHSSRLDTPERSVGRGLGDSMSNPARRGLRALPNSMSNPARKGLRALPILKTGENGWQTWMVFGLLAIALMGRTMAQTVDSVLTNRVNEPYNVAVEADVYYISDSANDRIVQFVPDSGAFTTLAGFAGRPGAVDAKGVYARFFNPRGLISVPARGGLVVADYANHTIRLVKLDGTVTTLAGTPTVPGFDSVHLNFPSALAADTNGNVYITDSKNNAIRELDLLGNLTTLATGFNEPNGIAVGDNGDLWISDSRNHTIKRMAADGTIELAAGTPGQSGALDSIFASETLFNNPGALLWLGGSNGLLVCDTGNDALRQVYSDPEIIGYSVQTYAGVPTQAGFVDGPLLQAKFNAPAGLTLDPTGGFLVADLGNNAIRRIQISPPQPPVTDPVIGWVDYQKDQFGELLSKLVPVTQAVFNNDVVIAIISETGTETYFTYGPTPPSSLQDNIPSPNRLTGNSPPSYKDGLQSQEVPPSIIPPQADVTIKVIGTADGRKPSDIVQARFQFKTANPTILGDNAASFVVTNITANAQLWYTTDGSDPTVNGSTSTEVSPGTISLPRVATNILFKIRAFRTSYAPSEIVSKTFLPADYQANRISFGFENGEASSDFVASPGQIFYAPVTLSLLPNQTMYTLQFNLTVTNLVGPAVAPGAVGFQSMLMEKLNLLGGVVYVPIPPALFLNGLSVPSNIQLPLDTNSADLHITNSSLNLLGVGWLERGGKTNLYDTTKQDLITYSIAHDTIFSSASQQVIAGGFMFAVPTNAAPGSTYQIQIGRPSATSDGINQDNFIEAVTDGTLTATPTNLINSIKWVTIGQRQYIVGDVAPFHWFNAGDFGDTNLLNNDVVQVFQSAVYALDDPPVGSDFFDAMDSSNGSTNSIYSGDDTAINNIQFGDGSLNVDDVYVTFRRSLDPSLTWYARYWANGQRQAVAVPNTFRGAPDQPGQTWTYRTAETPSGAPISGDPSVTFTTDDLQVSPGQVLQIPVRSKIIGNYPVRVLMLNLSVEPLDGSPDLTQPVNFTPVAALGQPTLTSSRTVGNYAAAWLNNQAAGVIGDTVIGQLTVMVPTNAPASAAYRVHFEHASASPNGLGLLPKQTQDGLLLLQTRTASSLGDGIPDTWRLRYFGSVSNILAQASADADGDGASNYAEFMAGTNPVDPKSNLNLSADRPLQADGSPRPLVLRWPSVLNKSYTIEAASSVASSDWTVLGSGIAGTGQELQFTAPNSPGNALFFRVRLDP
jgi:hypothetical protein